MNVTRYVQWWNNEGELIADMRKIVDDLIMLCMQFQHENEEPTQLFSFHICMSVRAFDAIVRRKSRFGELTAVDILTKNWPNITWAPIPLTHPHPAKCPTCHANTLPPFFEPIYARFNLE